MVPLPSTIEIDAQENQQLSRKKKTGRPACYFHGKTYKEIWGVPISKKKK